MRRGPLPIKLLFGNNFNNTWTCSYLNYKYRHWIKQSSNYWWYLNDVSALSGMECYKVQKSQVPISVPTTSPSGPLLTLCLETFPKALSFSFQLGSIEGKIYLYNPSPSLVLLKGKKKKKFITTGTMMLQTVPRECQDSANLKIYIFT